MKDTRDHSPKNLAASRSCYTCGSVSRELRPYGHGGAWVCFECAFATPESTATAEQSFGALLGANEAASPLGATVLDGEGLRPLVPGDPVIEIVEQALGARPQEQENPE